MGILSVHRNLLSNSTPQSKYLSSSSNLWFVRSISSLSSPSGSSKAQSHAPTGDLKSNNKLRLLIEHFHNESGNDNSWQSLSRFPPYNYSIIFAENSWKDHHNLCNPFSACGIYSVVDYCNEWMLIFIYNKAALFFGHGEYLLWNPTTDKFNILPPPGPVFRTNHGFGFDSESDDYKVVRFPWFSYLDGDCGEDIDNQVKLYSLKTNSWKKIAYPSCGDPLYKPSFHVNGVCYWETILGKSNIILSFDFANEKFSSAPYIPRPPKFDKHSKNLFVDDFVLVEFDGSLAALVHSELGNYEKPFSFEVWGWNGESWHERVSRITVDVPCGVIKVVGLFQNDKLFLQGFNKGELLLFDCVKSKLENLSIRADPGMVSIFPFNAGSSTSFMGNK